MKKILLITALFTTMHSFAQLDSTSLRVRPYTQINPKQYVLVPVTSSLQLDSDFTLECWAKVPSVTAQQEYLIETYSGESSGGYVLRTNNGNIMVYAMGASQPSAVSTGLLGVNQWYHIAATYNDATDEVRFYINGNYNSSATLAVDNYTTTTELRIGARGDDANVNDIVHMDEVRIWNVVRTDNEIAANAFNCLSGSEPGLVLYYDFEDLGAGAFTADKSPYGNDGSVVGNVDAPIDGVFDCVELNSINENTTIEVSVAPNPSSSYLTITADAMIESIRIFDLNGTLVQTEKSNTFSVEALAEGMYILTISTEKGSISKRFVKK